MVASNVQIGANHYFGRFAMANYRAERWHAGIDYRSYSEDGIADSIDRYGALFSVLFHENWRITFDGGLTPWRNRYRNVYGGARISYLYEPSERDPWIQVGYMGIGSRVFEHVDEATGVRGQQVTAENYAYLNTDLRAVDVTLNFTHFGYGTHHGTRPRLMMVSPYGHHRFYNDRVPEFNFHTQVDLTLLPLGPFIAYNYTTYKFRKFDDVAWTVGGQLRLDGGEFRVGYQILQVQGAGDETSLQLGATLYID